LGDLIQHRRDLLGFRLGETGKRAADPTVIRPAGLPPGFGNRLILVNRMRRAAEVLQMLQPSQNGNQKFQNLSLRAVFYGFLVQQGRLDLVNQTNALGKLAPYYQHGVLGQRFWMVLAHGYSSPGLAISLPDQGSVVKVQVFAKKTNLLSDCTKVTLD
jgi:hypothetical protein